MKKLKSLPRGRQVNYLGVLPSILGTCPLIVPEGIRPADAYSSKDRAIVAQKFRGNDAAENL